MEQIKYSLLIIIILRIRLKTIFVYFDTSVWTATRLQIKDNRFWKVRKRFNSELDDKIKIQIKLPSFAILILTWLSVILNWCSYSKPLLRLLVVLRSLSQ